MDVIGDPMRGGFGEGGGMMGGGGGRVVSEQNEEADIQRLKIYRALGRDPFHWYYEPAFLANGGGAMHDVVFDPMLGRNVTIQLSNISEVEYPAFLCFSFFHAGFASCVNLLK